MVYCTVQTGQGIDSRLNKGGGVLHGVPGVRNSPQIFNLGPWTSNTSIQCLVKNASRPQEI